MTAISPLSPRFPSAARLARWLVLIVPLLVHRELSAQQLTAPASIQLRVLDARTDGRLAYAVITISALGIDQFTDSRGVFTLPAPAAGDYDVLVRRLGFLPFRGRLTLGADQPTVDVRLQRVPQQLSGMTVSASLDCANPGPPDSVRSPELFTLVSLLRENADRYRRLVSQHPFVAMQARALGELRETATFLQFADVAPMRLSDKSEYRAGSVVRRRGREYTMAIPTILELTDDRFARSHCFAFGGASTATTSAGDETWYRIQVRAADALDAPDVHGVFFLDSATAQLRRMTLELSRPDKLPGSLASVRSVEVSTTFAEIASGLSVIDAVCAVTRTKPVSSKEASETPAQELVPIELQKLVSYVFTSPPPDVEAQRQYPAPAWQSGTYVAPSEVWCQQ